MSILIINLTLCWPLVLAGQSAPPVQKLQPGPVVKAHRKPKPLPTGAATNDWPAMLGPTHNAISAESPLAKNWPVGGPPLVWEMEAGTGYAAPAVASNRLIYFHRIGDEQTVDCLHPETGQPHWRFSYQSQYKDRFGFNNGPRSSPVIDEGRVFVIGPEGKLHCLELATGRVVWQRHPVKEYNITNTYFGVGSTPLVDGDLLIVAVGAPGPGVVAYDKRNGKVRWKAEDDWAASYASPIPGVIHGSKRIFVFAGGDSRPPTGGLLSVNPLNGRIDFRFSWRAEPYASVNAASPVVIGNRVFISSAYKKGGVLLEIQPDSSAKPAWTTLQLGAHWCTPVHRDGYLYGFDGDSQNDTALVCLDLKDGHLVWRKQLEWRDEVERNGEKTTMSLGLMRGSLLWADGHFLALGEMGHLLWLDLSPDGCKVMARTWLFPARESFTLPVLSRGLLYVTQNKEGFLDQSQERLLCYDLRPVSHAPSGAKNGSAPQ